MSGDNAVRSLLEKMTQCASSPYLCILERYLLWQPSTLCYFFLFLFSNYKGENNDVKFF